MELLDRFMAFHRLFTNAPQIHMRSQSLMEKHALDVRAWLTLTESIQFLSPKEKEIAEDIFESALKASRALFILGDEISAWVGQQHIARACVKYLPGIHAAHNLAAAARYGMYQVLLEESETSLQEMTKHFDENQHPMAAQYWEIKGTLLTFRKKWRQAIPCFELAREHIELCSAIELKRWLKSARPNLIAHENLRMVDCLVNYCWNLENGDRDAFIRDIRKNLQTARNLIQSPMLDYLTGLNEVELHLLEGNLDDAKKLIDSLLDENVLKSRHTSILHPGAYMMKARVADIEGDQRAMISYMSRALSESTIMFPDVMQELQVVHYALDLIRRNAMTRKEWQPLMEAMVLMLEAKDWYTGRDHSKSVARTAVNLWKGWKKEDGDPSISDELYWAAYLHDIGKLLLPRSLLNKIAPLGDAEWRIIRRHPANTREMLMSLGADQIAEWAGEHHQDAVGGGYPGDKPASEFGLCIAIADILEAATTPDRKYRKPKTLPQIISELKAMGPKKYPLELLEVADTFC